MLLLVFNHFPQLFTEHPPSLSVRTNMHLPSPSVLTVALREKSHHLPHL